MRTRLNRGTALPGDAGRPVQPTRAGIVHLGVGAFHRAHQAVYAQDAMHLSGDLRWGIVGVTGRSRRVVDDLAPQDGLFSVLSIGGDKTLDVVGAIVDVLSPAEDTARVLAALADPGIHIVTITATESAYPATSSGALDVERVADDLDVLVAEAAGETLGCRPATSMLGMLTRGLAARHRATGAALTIMSCDNIVGNGRLLEGLVDDAIVRAFGEGELIDWVRAHVTFPNTMVDRLTPAPTDEVRREVADMIGADDLGAVITEPFRQWVIEDRFAGPRPPWELAGATFTDDIAPYEELKLRLLNGTHSALAYAGAVRGCVTIDEAMADPIAAGIAKLYLYGDAIPSLEPPPGVDVYAYADSLLTRFSNAALGHTVAKVCMDASLKIPLRWGPVARARLLEGKTPHGVAAAFAMWLKFLRQRRDLLHDPRRAELEELVDAAATDAELLDAILRSGIVLDPVVAEDPRFAGAVFTALERIPADHLTPVRSPA